VPTLERVVFIFSFLRITFFATIILLVSLGCASSNSLDQSSSHNIRILMTNSGHFYPTFYIESVEPNALRFISFGLIPGAESLEMFDYTLLDDFFSKDPSIELIVPTIHPSRNVITNEWMLELSEEQSSHIRRLTENIARNRSDGQFDGPLLGSIPYVWTIINDNIYWSYYTADIEMWKNIENPWHINNDLLYLIYEIIDLSPYPIRGWATPNGN